MPERHPYPVQGHLRGSARGYMIVVRRHVRRGAYRPPANRGAMRGLSDNQVRDLIRGGRFAIVSASLADKSPEENDARCRTLEKQIETAGFPYLYTEGSYVMQEGPYRGQTIKETGYLVPDLPREIALRWARRHDQESVVFNDRLLKASNGETIMRFDPKKTLFGREASAQPFYTRVLGTDIVFSMRG